MIRADKLHKQYQMGDSVVHALDGVDLTIDEGEFVAIIGASGHNDQWNVFVRSDNH